MASRSPRHDSRGQAVELAVDCIDELVARGKVPRRCRRENLVQVDLVGFRHSVCHDIPFPEI
jgi:hypothetical protein